MELLMITQQLDMIKIKAKIMAFAIWNRSRLFFTAICFKFDFFYLFFNILFYFFAPRMLG
jgi:hypothetical protein